MLGKCKKLITTEEEHLVNGRIISANVISYKTRIHKKCPTELKKKTDLNSSFMYPIVLDVLLKLTINSIL